MYQLHLRNIEMLEVQTTLPVLNQSNLNRGDVSDLERNEFEYDIDQLNAINNCLDPDKRIVAVTGEAGTGKTTIMQDVYHLFSKRRKVVVLCAPTGKAAKRITEATGIPAVTIHRLLEYPMPGEIDEDTGKALVTTDPKRDRRNPIGANVVLCDEYAMVNTEVHRNLLDALPPGGIIRMFGDANQLQPIESSDRRSKMASPFNRMLDKFEGSWLTSIHRQAEDSSIISNGHRIILGMIPKRADDFILKITEEPVRAVENFVMENMDDGVDYTSITNQVISPTKQGWIGTVALNAIIQGLLIDPNQLWLEVERHKWSKQNYLRIFKGDKVIQTVNQYGLEVFNGETGIVEGFDDAAGIIINFGDKTTTIPSVLEMEGRDGVFYINPQKDIDLAYVITTHKSQGSEYNEVCYVLNKSRTWQLNRKNLYTGISRARKKVTIIADQKGLVLSLDKKGDK
tara:strand:- start:7846 stop:9210 length:1365 start_codon:yes stop_codon:yes gene_type:complete